MCYERRRAEACVDESAHHAQGLGLTLNKVCLTWCTNCKLAIPTLLGDRSEWWAEDGNGI